MMRLLSSPMPDLPDDLVEEILTSVPAMSLKRLRYTCKKWNTLFNDRKFTKKHSHKAKKEYLDLIMRNDRLSWMGVNLHKLHDNTDPSPIEFKAAVSLDKFYNHSDNAGNFKVFHCNGFLLCTNMSTIVVWNPCTGQTKRILTRSLNKCNHLYALGYANKNLCHDYKILRFLSDEKFEVEIFDFNPGSWRVSGTVSPKIKLHVSGVSVKGNTYWIAFDNDFIGFLISFDFATERFGPRLCLPFQGCYCYTPTMSLCSVREERLSVLFQNNDASKTEVWMTHDIIETNVMSWSKFLVHDFNVTRTLWPAYFFIDEENKFAVVSEYGSYSCFDRAHRLYIIGEDKCRTVNLRDEPRHLLSYVPSLVQI